MRKSTLLACLAGTVMVGAALLLNPLGFTQRAAQTGHAPSVNAERTVPVRDIKFGIVPQQAASRLAEIWTPFAEYLTAATGMTVHFVTTTDIPTFEACLAAGVFDMAYMNPYHYVVFSESAGYRAIAHQADKKLHGLIVVRKDSQYARLEDLDLATLAFPSPGAFGASVLPRAEMRARDINFTADYVRSHDSVYRAVARGLVTAGGGVRRTFNAISPELQDDLRVIYRTADYTPHAIAVSTKVDTAVAEKIAAALENARAAAPVATKALGMTGFVRARDTSWDDVRALNIKSADAGLDKIDGIKCPFD